MAKGREIPGDKAPVREGPPPMAPAQADVDALRDRVAKLLGISDPKRVRRAFAKFAEGHELMELNTAYRLLRGEGSIKALRDIEEVVVREEHRRGVAPAPLPTASDELLDEWHELGARLQAAASSEFTRYLDAVRELVEARERENKAIIKLFRATP